MKGRQGAKRPKTNPPPPVSRLKGRAGALPNPKLGAQARKLLGKHCANKYRTLRRG